MTNHNLIDFKNQNNLNNDTRNEADLKRFIPLLFKPEIQKQTFPNDL